MERIIGSSNFFKMLMLEASSVSQAASAERERVHVLMKGPRRETFAAWSAECSQRFLIISLIKFTWAGNFSNSWRMYQISGASGPIDFYFEGWLLHRTSKTATFNTPDTFNRSAFSTEQRKTRSGWMARDVVLIAVGVVLKYCVIVANLTVRAGLWQYEGVALRCLRLGTMMFSFWLQ